MEIEIFNGFDKFDTKWSVENEMIIENISSGNIGWGPPSNVESLTVDRWLEVLKPQTLTVWTSQNNDWIIFFVKNIPE